MIVLNDQGYVIMNNIVYQDNQSTIRTENNRKNSCTWNSRHINMRYLFVKDRLDKGEMKIVYCSTQMILADYFTNRSKDMCLKYSGTSYWVTNPYLN